MGFFLIKALMNPYNLGEWLQIIKYIYYFHWRVNCTNSQKDYAIMVKTKRTTEKSGKTGTLHM